jgi:radical SAM-linked protein
MRIRVTFAKNGALRYVGHLDLHKMWERVTRRAGLPLAYSQGFHPSPKIQLAAALPLGFSSRCELVDLWVEGESDLAGLAGDLQETVPPGLKILNVEQVEEKSPPLQTQILSAEFEAVLAGGKNNNALEEKLATVLQADSLPRERRGKAYDLRPLIEELKLLDPDADGKTRLFMRLSAREGATGRPEEVLDVLGLPLDGIHTERTRLIFKENV